MALELRHAGQSARRKILTAGIKRQWIYDEHGQTLAYIDERGGQSTYGYNTHGQLSTRIDNAGYSSHARGRRIVRLVKILLTCAPACAAGWLCQPQPRGQ
ncbi:MAG: RHS repeat protein [Burkholderiaceae bacterium]|nr:RHS repeat protein [Burkholderiaceae bacterium]